MSNRLPVAVGSVQNGIPGWKRSPGGLVSALEPVLAQRSAGWIGWAGGVGEATIPLDLQQTPLIAVPLDAGEISSFYDGFCNSTIWPLYHDALVAPRFQTAWWDAYVLINRRFATAVAAHAAFRATVWVHDYQLQLVPTMLRRLRPDLGIGFFNHIPFPAWTYFGRLPWWRSIVQGVLGADVVGFQRSADVANFLRACRHAADLSTATTRSPVEDNVTGRRTTLAVAGPGPEAVHRTVTVDAYPVSVDPAKWADLTQQPTVQARARAIRTDLGHPRTVLLGLDRLDYIKGIPQRLRAYEALLDDGTVTPTDTVLIQIATPSRENIPEYRALSVEVQAVVDRINQAHAVPHRPAVQYLHRAGTPAEVAALYIAADVMLVTSLRDGMNLVAKEYIACHPGNGALILSMFTGAADELGPGAYLVDPFDRDSLKDAVLRALSASPATQRTRMRLLHRVIEQYDNRYWAATFLAALTDQLQCENRPSHTATSPASPAGALPGQPIPP